MPARAMALSAPRFAVPEAPAIGYLRDEIPVAAQAIFLKIAQVSGRDPDGFRKVLQRKSFGVIPSVFHFRKIFRREMVRQMAVVTSGSLPVACLHPRVVVILHDVAVGTGFGIVKQIRVAFGVKKGIDPQAGQNSKGNGEKKKQDKGQQFFHNVAKRIGTGFPLVFGFKTKMKPDGMVAESCRSCKASVPAREVRRRPGDGKLIFCG